VTQSLGRGKSTSTMATANSPSDWDVRIDTRPLRKILFERAASPAVIAIATVLFAVVITRTPPGGLDGRGLAALAGTPANAIAYASGFITLRDMVVPGAILNVVSWVVFNAMSVWWWPVLGIVIDSR